MMQLFETSIESIRLTEQKRDRGLEEYLKMEYKRI